MKLSDVVAHAGLALYAEVALVLFLIVFVAVLFQLFRSSRSADLEAQRLLPLEPESPAPPREGAAR
jgi:cbb3-type cytochrome oxidase subunit 3